MTAKPADTSPEHIPADDRVGSIPVDQTSHLLAPDGERILYKPYVPGNEAVCREIVEMVLGLSEEQSETLLRRVLDVCDHQRFDMEGLLTQRFRQIESYLGDGPEPGHTKRALIGAYFLFGYTLESSALFNPSIVPHPNQEGLAPGLIRFVLSLRAIGEGHVSSIEFRSGTVDDRGKVSLDPSPHHIVAPMEIEMPSYQKQAFRITLNEMGLYDQLAATVVETLQPQFTNTDLEERIASLRAHGWSRKDDESAGRILHLARSNFSVRFGESIPLSQRVIHPPIAAARQGIEDARFVKFIEDDGDACYYATYTAWNGQITFPQLLQTRDFLRFRMRTLRGPAARNKGLALFPRRIAGKYAMISRVDNRNLFLMSSDEVDHWQEARPLAHPLYDWEFVKIGNCGSPIETDEGWLLLTHGVGAMRQYCIGAMLLDLDDPSKVIGRLAKPLLKPGPHGQRGYVPDVVYSCGAMLHHGNLVLPYGVSDQATTISTISLSKLLAALTS